MSNEHDATYCDDDITEAPSTQHLSMRPYHVHNHHHHHHSSLRNHQSPHPQDLMESIDILNQQISDYGLHSIELIAPANDSINSKPHNWCMSTDGVLKLLNIIETLLQDTRDRQELVQELIVANKALKHNYNAANSITQSETEGSSAAVAAKEELKSLLEAAYSQIQKLRNENNNLKKDLTIDQRKFGGTRIEMKKRCEDLEMECKNLRSQIDDQNRLITKLSKEKEEFVGRQNEIFRQLKNRSANKFTSNDTRLLHVIEAYEKRIEELEKSSNLVHHLSNVLDLPLPQSVEEQHWIFQQSDAKKHATDEIVNRLKEIIHNLQQELGDSQQKKKDLEVEIELMKLDLTNRPNEKQYCEAVMRLKKYEAILRRHNIDIKQELSLPSIRNTSTRTDANNSNCNNLDCQSSMQYSPLVVDLHFLPLRMCQYYLRAISDIFINNSNKKNNNERDLTWNQVVKSIEENHGAKQRLCDLQRLADRVCDIVKSSSSVSSSSLNDHVLEVNQLPHRIRGLVDEINYLPRISACVRELRIILTPWNAADKIESNSSPAVAENVKMSSSLTNVTASSLLDEMQDLIHILSSSSSTPLNANENSFCPPPVAQKLVLHFMNLFDCQQFVSVYARIQQIFTRLNEAQNALRAIASHLCIDVAEGDWPPVGQIMRQLEQRLDDKELNESLEYVECKSTMMVTKQPNADICDLITPQQLADLMDKLDHYEHFFPAFEELVNQLMEDLDLDNIAQVIPTVRELLTLRPPPPSLSSIASR